jgi:anti-anti-sigma factor
LVVNAAEVAGGMAQSDAPEGEAVSSNGADSTEIFRVESTDASAVLALIGELDIAGVPALSTAIASVSSAHNGLTFDLSRLTFIDSSGLNELLRALREHDGRIRLVSPQPNVLRVLDIAGVLPAFDVVDAQPGEPPESSKLA